MSARRAPRWPGARLGIRALQGPQGRADEEVERDHGRHRVARKAEQGQRPSGRRRSSRAEPRGLARAAAQRPRTSRSRRAPRARPSRGRARPRTRRPRRTPRRRRQAARSSAARVASGSSGTVSVLHDLAPGSVRLARQRQRVGAPDLPRAERPPGSTSSSPVARIAPPVGRRAAHRAWPAHAGQHAERRGRQRVAGAMTQVARRATSSPRAADVGSRPRRGARAPSRRRPAVRSTGTTAAVPAGMAAPVEMAIAVPGSTATGAGLPARDSPMTSSSPSGAVRHGEAVHRRVSKGGTSTWLRTSSASTRPRAASRATLSGRRGRTAASTRPRASSIPISAVTAPSCQPGGAQRNGRNSAAGTLSW